MNRTVRLAAALGLALGACAASAATPIDAKRAASANARVEINNVRGRVDVRGWARNEVAVTGTLGEGAKFSLTGSDAHVVVRVETEDGNFSWWGGNGPREDTILTVNVPAAAALDVDTVSADVDVEGISGAKELEVESVSGDVRVRGDAERVELTSVSGDLDVESNTRALSVETVSGDVDAKRVSGRIDAESVSGTIRLEAERVDDLNAATVSGDVELRTGALGSGRIKVESMSGEVDIAIPANASARIEAESFSGSITSDFGKVEEEEHGPGSSLSAVAGKGEAQITLESFSGDVTLRRN
ncbi:MAG TPA: DUF4097 family beta strand repeat-containing protein [Candidatus Saccharimonadia bacterium]|nr:DUF4097 family beta strand repeat-containing protein [Candidatus Saccharimonadia bacterium]